MMHCALWLLLLPVSAGYLAAVGLAPDATRTAIAEATGFGREAPVIIAANQQSGEATPGLRTQSDVPQRQGQGAPAVESDDVAALRRELAEAKARAAALEAEKQAIARERAAAVAAVDARQSGTGDSLRAQGQADDASGQTGETNVASFNAARPADITTGSIPVSVPQQPTLRDVKVTTVPITGTSASGAKLPPLPPRVPQDLRRTASAAIASRGIEILNQPGATAPRAPVNPPTDTSGTLSAPELPATTQTPLTRSESPGFEGQTIAFGPATVETNTASLTAPEAGVGIQLSTGPSVDSLRLSWVFLQEAHPSVLTGLKPKFRTDDAGSAGAVYRLLAGPRISRREADQVCGLLRARSVPCTIASFDGEPLPAN